MIFLLRMIPDCILIAAQGATPLGKPGRTYFNSTFGAPEGRE